MNFSKFQQILNAKKSHSAEGLLMVVHYLIHNHFFTSYDDFDLIENGNGSLIGVIVYFDGFLSKSQFSYFAKFNKFFMLGAYNNRLCLRIYCD